MKTEANSIKLWNPVVPAIPAGLWLLVMGFFVAYFTHSNFLILHAWAGYLTVGVIGFHLLWHLNDNLAAPFADFERTPTQTDHSLRIPSGKGAKRNLLNNLGGAAMVIVVLLSLLTTVASGMVVYAFNEGAGPLAAWLTLNDERGALWLEIHEVATQSTMLLIALHVFASVFAGQTHRRNLGSVLLSGGKKIDRE